MRGVQAGADPAPRERRQLTHAERATEAWADLLALYVDEGRKGRLKVREQPGRFAKGAALWPLSQVVHAGLLVAGLTGDAGVVPDLFEVMEGHRQRRGDAYLPYPGSGPVFFDDNAWVGLDQVQAGLVGLDPDGSLAEAAFRTLGVVAGGQAPSGAVRWQDVPGSPVNTCSTAPAVELALRLAEREGDLDRRERLLAFADAADRGLDLLRRDDRLYADHVDPDGEVEHSIWAYNQGTPVGADVLWWRLTGDEGRLDRAEATARAALAELHPDRLWSQPPAFVGVFFRNLLALDATRPVPGLLDEVDAWLERVWSRARDPRTGRIAYGGIGRYDAGGAIDHAGVVQVLAARAWPPERRSAIC